MSKPLIVTAVAFSIGALAGAGAMHVVGDRSGEISRLETSLSAHKSDLDTASERAQAAEKRVADLQGAKDPDLKADATLRAKLEEARAAQKKAEEASEAAQAAAADSSARLSELIKEKEGLVRRVDELASKLLPSGPLAVAFGSQEAQDLLGRADWKQLAKAGTELSKALKSYLEAVEAGKQPSMEDMMAMGRQNQVLVKHALELDGKLHSEGGNANGPFTHPLNLANQIAATLKEAGIPLTKEQRIDFIAAGDAYLEEIKTAAARHSESTLALERVADELDAKMRAMDRMMAGLDSAQVAALYPSDTRGLHTVDIFSPTLMMIIIPRSATGDDEAADLTTKEISKALGMNEQDVLANPVAIQEYLRETAFMRAAASAPKADMLRCEWVPKITRAYLKMLQSIDSNAATSVEARAKAREARIIYVARTFPKS